MIIFMGKFIKFFVSSILVVAILLGGIVLLSNFFDLGGIKTYSVLTGSMDPAIKTGSLIFIKKQENYSVGDIVTKTGDESGMTVTHRIISITEEDGNVKIKTKGDANNVEDEEFFDKDAIIGKVFFHIPFAGYLTNYAQTPYGLMVIVVIPAVIIVYEEIGKIKKELIQTRKNRKEKENSGETRKEEHPVAEGRKIPVKLSKDESFGKPRSSEGSSSKKPKKLIW
jgi:signal peptidase